jgi:predicted chitinase
MKYYKMTPERAAHFFGQTAHETGGFNTFRKPNYSATGLRGTLKNIFQMI